MEAILDFTREFDVQLFDRIVNTFYTGRGADQHMAQQVLTQFQENPDAWTRADVILTHSQVAQSKYIALQVLEKVIQTRWKILPVEQSQGIKNYVVSLIIKVSSEDATMVAERTFLHKLNIVLVQILKQDWPQKWPTFISEIVASSRTSVSLCENNMHILKLLSEEIYDFGCEQLTQRKVKTLKEQMSGEFNEIYTLCWEILQKAQKPSLIMATLDTLLRFLNWIPTGYIFGTQIISLLIEKFLEPVEYRNVTLKCLTEIASLSSGQHEENCVAMFDLSLKAIYSIVPVEANIEQIYETSNDRDQEFVQNLAMYFTTMLSNHLTSIEEKSTHASVLLAHQYLIKISRVEEREIFKVCLEYWAKLVADLYEQIQLMPLLDVSPLLQMPLGLGGAPVPRAQQRKDLYSKVSEQLRFVIIERMVRPEEVLVVENDEGEVVREFVKETDTIQLYKAMRECLVYLTHLDVLNTEMIMMEKLNRQVDGTEWSWGNLNKLCWAIGSISGAMNEDAEKRFLVTVIKELLALTEMKRGKDNKAIVASNIMYIVGQYPRFLKSHWKFLKTVINKLFEFMHELHEGVQDMACDTFIKISQKCRRHFVLQQVGEVRPFIDEILEYVGRITSDLQPQQVHTFYEGVGYMVAAQTNVPVQQKLLSKMMEQPNLAWDNIMRQAAADITVLQNNDTLKVLINVLKTNVSACTSVGSGFYPQLARNFMDLLALYRTISQNINDAIVKQGIVAARTPLIRHMRAVKKEFLCLCQTYIQNAEDVDTVAKDLIPPLFDTILGDYNRTVEAARESQVLHTTAVIIEKLKVIMMDQVAPILDAVFSCTVEMISRDFSEYPEHRTGFFEMLKSINSYCFQSLVSLPPHQFKLIMDSTNWAYRHTHRDIQDTGLLICLDLINNVSNLSDPTLRNAFYQSYLLEILGNVLIVLTDTEHKSGFKGQIQILARIFELVQAEAVTAPLFDPQVRPDVQTNREFLSKHVTEMLQTAFAHLQPIQIQQFVEGLFEYNRDLNRFKLHVRDFLIQLKEFSGDNTDLYLEEKEIEMAAKKQEELNQALKVPGLMKPSEMPSMEED